MSIQEQPVHYNIPDQISSSSIVINRGNEEYDPFAMDDDDHHENEQFNDTKHQKQESIRINNGNTNHPVINNMNTSSSLIKTNEQQQSRRQSQSPVEHHRKPSDRKRLRPSSPDSSTTVNNNESSNSEQISSSKYKSDRKKSKHYHKHQSSSVSPTSSSFTSNNHKKSSDSKDKKSFNSSDSHRSSKRDDYHSHRSNSSRHYHSSSKYSSRNDSHETHIDRRTANFNNSSPSRIPSTAITSDGNSSFHHNNNNQSNDHQTSKEDRNRIFNRLKNVNEMNTPSIVTPINNSNKSSSAGSAFINSNGGSQRSRSNLIQIVTTKATPLSSQVSSVRLSSSQTKPEPIKPISVPSIPAKIESTTNANAASKSNTTTTVSKTNGGTADDMLMEEMLLEAEQEQSPVKSIDLDSLTIPETSTQTTDNINELMKITPTTSVVATTTASTTTATTTSASSLTPSPTKKPYTLYKVPHTNHMTPPLSSRHKKQTKKEPSITQSDATNKSSTEDKSLRTSLDERISTLSGIPLISSNKPTNSLIEQQLDVRPNLPTQTTISTPSDKSTESPQDIKSLILTIKKERDQSSVIEKLNINEERRSTTSKHYTTEWLASQKPEEAPTEELTALPALVPLPTLFSSQPSTKTSISNTGEGTMLGKLSEAMSKLIQKQGDTNAPTTTEAEDAVPVSAKHLERMERRRQREKRQSEIAAIAKEALKPAFKKHTITKDEYKEIMKKVVTKATNSNEIDRVRIGKMIAAYVEKYRTSRPHHTSTTSHVNGL